MDTQDASDAEQHRPDAHIAVCKEFNFEDLLARSILRQATAGEVKGDFNHLFSLSPLSSPSPSARSSPEPPLDIPPNPTPEPPLLQPPDAQAPGTSGSGSTHDKRRGHANRKRKRAATREEEGPAGYGVRSKARKKHVGGAEAMRTDFEGANIRVASTGYVGVREGASSTTYPLADLVGPSSRFKFDLIEWDGRSSVAILDAEGRIIAVLVGRPGADPTWEQACAAAADKLEDSRGRLDIPSKQKRHRRGHFPALATGISHGGGQMRPGNLCNNAANSATLSSLTSHPAFIRLAGFASSAFANWAPKLYGYYSEHLERLLAHNDRAHRPFKNSVWAAATFNFGPATTCFKHKDTANLPFGWCGITALGTFDPKHGGHLVLWEARRVIEFPPGSTVLIPSAAIAHSNTPIQAGERRYSFTQYTAGGIFRWVDHNFKPEEQYWRSVPKAQRAAQAEELSHQLTMGLGLFSTVAQLKNIQPLA